MFRSQRFSCFLLLTFLLLTPFSVAQESTGPPSQPDGNTGSIGSPPAEPPPSQEFVDLVPDQKLLLSFGIAKLTDIDLNQAYKDLNKTEGNLNFELEEKGSSKVAAVSIEQNRLIVQWKNMGKTQITLRITNPSTGDVYFDRVQLETWYPDYWIMFFSVFGGLGIFLIGMKYMSDGLQNIASSSLRRLIAVVTSNRFFGVFIGFLVTGVIQSSSACTVMVVGFINSQMMTLSQSIGVIMGSNIGTTVTAWILTIPIAKYGLPMIGVAAVFYLFAKADRIRFLSMIVIGLGFLFFGMELMASGFAPLKDIPGFYLWMAQFSADTYKGVLLCALVGCVLTMIVQSSSATVAITISLAGIGVIDYNSAVALVLGENIGTTITAILASIGTSVNARRAAAFHTMFNVIGVCWVSSIFYVAYLPLLYYLIGTNEAGEIKDPKVGIALAHSIFNITNTIVFLPFTRVCARLMEYIIPDSKKTDEKSSPRLSLNRAMTLPPAIGLERSRTEVLRMGDICLQLSDRVKEIIVGDCKNEAEIEAAFGQEELLDYLQDEIIDYTTHLLSDNISQEISEMAHQQLRMADEMESMGDCFIAILKSNIKMNKDGLALPESQRQSMRKLHTDARLCIASVLQCYSYEDRNIALPELMVEINVHGRTLTQQAKEIRSNFIGQLMNSDAKYDPRVVIALNTQLSAYRQVREHVENVAEVLAGTK